MPNRRDAMAALVAACAAPLAVAQRASKRAPRTARRKGINGNELHTLDPAALARTVSTYRSLGVQWVRFDFDWSVIQAAGPQAFDIAHFERTVQALRSADIDVLGLIAYAPGWVNGGRTKFHPPMKPVDFANFAARLARHFSPLGVHAWEIWNEPNLGQFWAPRADPQAYSALLARAYDAIHEADAGAIVVSGGLAQPFASPTDIEVLDFARRLCAAAGPARCFDALGNHPYMSPRLPSDSGPTNWRKMFATPDNLRSILAEYGRASRAIWITEFGAPTMGVDTYGTVIPEARQASMLEQAYRLAAGYEWAGPLFWYNLQDFCPPDPARSSECYFGLLRQDGSFKPAALAYKALNL